MINEHFNNFTTLADIDDAMLNNYTFFIGIIQEEKL